jgi:UDP-N-acetylglucosamine--N-acetylmuramyl-(pentapeptide) pyrophosphoryl-undecaprenol N-acetylglucosamine transferase
MKILVTGGGSGGHITPLLAVATELTQQTDAVIVYIGQRNDRVAAGIAEHEAIDRVYTIWAGKLRRYHGEGWKQLLDIKTMFFNIRDVFYTLMGIIQALWIVRHERPDVLFIKGGFVSVPVGLAAAFWRVPFVTHDSDAVAGLANRIVARWAAVHAVGLPEKLYNYPPQKTKTVGVPIAKEYKKVHSGEEAKYRANIGLSEDAQVVFVTGGGLGAHSISSAVVAAAPQLLRSFPNLYIVHLTGHKQHKAISALYDTTLQDTKRNHVITKDFVPDLYRYSGAADVIVTRAGATSIAEFAMQGKACIIVPNPVLAGGHQLRNAEAYESAGAALVIKESELHRLLEGSIASLLNDQTTRHMLGVKLNSYANSHAARDLAELIVQTANLRTKKRVAG